nr:hypothetical protein [Tanacetum cinerariifolium]
GSGRSLPCFFLDRDLTETLITGYSIPLRHRVIVRLRELEDHFSEAPRVPTTLPEALRLAADQAEENQKLHMVIQQQAPKVEALERLANTQGSLCITDAAKHIGIQPLQVFAWMSKNRWIYRRSSFANWSAFQPRISSGLLEHKLVKVRNNESEELKIVEQVMVTRRGLVVLAEKINGASLDGRGAFPSALTLSEDTGLSERTVRLKLDELEKAGFITEGNQAIAAAYIDRRDRRPVVYDLQIKRGANAAPRKERGADNRTGCSSRQNGVQENAERGAAAAPNTPLNHQETEEQLQRELADEIDRQESAAAESLMKSVTNMLQQMSNVPTAAVVPLKADAGTVQVINSLFRELMAIFPAWKQAWPDDDALKAAKASWTKAFMAEGIQKIEQVRFGIEQCRKIKRPFAPSSG